MTALISHLQKQDKVLTTVRKTRDDTQRYQDFCLPLSKSNHASVEGKTDNKENRLSRI